MLLTSTEKKKKMGGFLIGIIYKYKVTQEYFFWRKRLKKACFSGNDNFRLTYLQLMSYVVHGSNIQLGGK